LGRVDDQINIGGMRLEPGEVESVLEAFSGIEQAVVTGQDSRRREDVMAQASSDAWHQAISAAGNGPDRLQAIENALRVAMPGPNVLVAHIKAPSPIDLALLRAHVSKSLPPLRRPARYVFHTKFPITPSGKVDRKRLSDQSAPLRDTKAAEAPLSSQDDNPALMASVLAVFRTALGNDLLGPDVSFLEFGGHSLLAMRLLLTLEEEFDLRLQLGALYDDPTARSFYRAHIAVAEAPVASGDRNQIVIPFNRAGTNAPVFALHNLETNGALYRPMAARLGVDHPFYGIGQIGRPSLTGDWTIDGNADPDVAQTAAAYVAEIERLAPDGPVVLMGHCLGAVYAYEAALQLQSRGREPVSLIMLHDLHAPDLAISNKPRLQAMLATRLDQIRQAKLSALPLIVKKLPGRISWLGREIVRQTEIVALKFSTKRRKPLSERLMKRKFIEDSYWNVKAYDFAPYSGRVLAVRYKDSAISHGEGQETGWGKRLSNLEILTVESQIGSRFMDEPWVEPVADAVLAECLSAPMDRGAPSASIASEKRQRKVHRAPNYEISIEFSSHGFIDAPSEAQRDWLVQRRLQETSREFEHLTARAHEMVRADGSIDIDGRELAPVSGEEIMEDWQIPVMQGMADLTARPGTDILEIGFGRGVSAEMIQQRSVRSHSIVECNPHVVGDFERWRDTRPDHDIRMIEGRWQDVTDRLGQYDGILFHTYPLDDDEMVQNLAAYSTFAEQFFPVAATALRPGGVFTYFTNEADSISRPHQRALLDHFDGFQMSRLDALEIPENSADAHWYTSIVLIQAFKSESPG
ncbi:MAG: thioesterase domain-containing protein, partial [Pseudomonadota bacterium]